MLTHELPPNIIIWKCKGLKDCQNISNMEWKIANIDGVVQKKISFDLYVDRYPHTRIHKLATSYLLSITVSFTTNY